MTINKKLAVLLLSPFLITACNNKKEMDLQIRITHQKDGYGYQILKDRKAVITQPFIPAVAGDQPFRDSVQAKKTAELALRKLHKYKLPSISISELDSMKIEYH